MAAELAVPGPAPVLVSVVVVNLDRADLLEACLKSLLAQDYPHFEIIVVDNGSTDGSAHRVRALNDRRISLIELPFNLGFAGGCNAGIRAAAGEYIALLNNDAEARPDWLRCLVEEMSAHPECGMVASRILFHGTRVIDKAGHRIFWDGQNRGFGTGRADGDQFAASAETLCPDGCAALYRRELLRETEGFDEDFLAYADDADLGLRARWLGWSARYCGAAVVEHRHSSTSGRFSPDKIYLVERNRIWLLVKNFPWILIWLSPVTTLYRLGWNLLAGLAGRGAAGNFRREADWWSLVASVGRAWRDAAAGLPAMRNKRRRLRRTRRIPEREFWRLLWRYRISARCLAFEDYRRE